MINGGTLFFMLYDDCKKARGAQMRGERNIRITPEAARNWHYRGTPGRPMTEVEAELWKNGSPADRVRVKKATWYGTEIIA